MLASCPGSEGEPGYEARYSVCECLEECDVRVGTLPIIRGVPNPITAYQQISAPLISRLTGCYGRGRATPCSLGVRLMLYFVDHLSSFCCVVIDIQSRVSFASRAQVILSYLMFPIETRHDMISKKRSHGESITHYCITHRS